MPPPATVDSDEEDLDDLDDIIPTLTAPSLPPKPTLPPPNPTSEVSDDLDDAAFEAELAKGMAALLGNLGHATAPGAAPAGLDGLAGLEGLGEGKGLEELLRKMMAGEGGLEGLLDGDEEEEEEVGENGEEKGISRSDIPKSTGAKDKGKGKEELSFEETIKRTMENLKTSSNQPTSSGAEDPLSALLSSLSPNGLDSDDPSEIGKMLDGMMGQLMTREVLEEPLRELADKYPPYLSSHPDLPATEKKNYTLQLALITQILSIFSHPSFTDTPAAGDTAGQERKRLVGELMGRMQELGSPPEEVMGGMPEGFDLADLGGLGGGEEGCTIM